MIAADGFEKTLRLVISSGLVSRKKFVDALEEQLKPRLAKVTTGQACVTKARPGGW